MIEAECPVCGCIFGIPEEVEERDTTEDRARRDGYLAGLEGRSRGGHVEQTASVLGAWKAGHRAGTAVRKQKGES